MIVNRRFFNQDPQRLAVALLGKRLVHLHPESRCRLSAIIIETEAYYLRESASHSSRGFTEKRRAMFMPPGTIYMYFARGGDSLNFSALGKGNAVLIKSGFPAPCTCVATMQRLNPGSRGDVRPVEALCRGQTLLCRSLGLKVGDWNQKQLDEKTFYLEATGYTPDAYVQCRRLGIPEARDGHLLYRFVDAAYARHCTSNPLTKRDW